MKNLKIIFSIILFSVFLYATGGDTILNGGGQAELNSYTVVDNLDKYITFSLKKSHVLRFSDKDIRDLNSVLQNLKQGSISYPKFAYLNQKAFQTEKKWGSPITLNFASIYDVNGNPLSFTEVARVTLAAFLYQVSDQDESVILNCASKVFYDFQQNEQNLPLPLQSRSGWSVQSQTIFDSLGIQFAYLSLQNDKSEDLSFILQNKISFCSKVEFSDFNHLVLQPILMSKEQEIIQLQGSFQFRCSNQKLIENYDAKLLIDLYFENGKWDFNKTKSQIFDLKKQL